MESPRVFVICVNRLVCEAVNMLLRREGIELVGMETGVAAAFAQLRALQPNVVLVEGFDSAQVDGEGAQVEANLLAALAWLLYEKENLRIIRLDLADETLRVYHQEQRRLVNTQDLVAAINDYQRLPVNVNA